jgi:hypothetical protein
MANGTVVYHPEDLLPLVAANSETARAIDASSRGTVRTWIAGGIGGVAMVIGGYMWIEGQSKTSPDPTERNIGTGVFFAGVAAIGVAYLFRHGALEDTHDAFNLYTRDLAHTLRVCAQGMAIVACESVHSADDPDDHRGR